jgi:hypothetical protein
MRTLGLPACLKVCTSLLPLALLISFSHDFNLNFHAVLLTHGTQGCSECIWHKYQLKCTVYCQKRVRWALLPFFPRSLSLFNKPEEKQLAYLLFNFIWKKWMKPDYKLWNYFLYRQVCLGLGIIIFFICNIQGNVSNIQDCVKLSGSHFPTVTLRSVCWSSCKAGNICYENTAKFKYLG